MNYDRSIVLNNLLEMSDVLLQNNSLNIEPYVNDLNLKFHHRLSFYSSYTSFIHRFFHVFSNKILLLNIGHDEISLQNVQHKSFGSVVFFLLRTKTKMKILFVDHFRRYSTAANRLQQRTIEIFYRILIDSDEQYPWSTMYGALIGLCQMGHKVS